MSSSPSSTPTPTPTKGSASSSLMRSSPTTSSSKSSPGSRSSTTPLAPGATLTVTIVSTQNLSRREPPLGIELCIGARTATTGPPVQRHKNTNAFKFAASESVTLTAASLKDCYKDDLQLRVLYADTSTTNETETTTTTETAKIDLRELLIHQPKFMEKALDGGETTTTAAASASSTTGTTGTSSTTTTPVLALPPSPTIRLQLTLSAPYRREVQFAIQLATHWMRLADHLEHVSHDQRRRLMSHVYYLTTNLRTMSVPQGVLLSAAAVPVLLTIMVMAIPTLLMSLPFAVPIIMVTLGIGAIAVLAFVLVYASSSSGRHALYKTCEYLQLTRLWSQVVESPTGQSFLYDTGSYPSPVQVTRDILAPATETNVWTKLALSVAVDAMGNASYLLPLAGELADFAWAPLQTLLIVAMYDKTSPNLKYVSFVEEILPFTDVVPTATLGWCVEHGWPWLMEKQGAGGSGIASGARASTDASNKMDSASALMMMHPPVTDRIQ